MTLRTDAGKNFSATNEHESTRMKRADAPPRPRGETPFFKSVPTAFRYGNRGVGRLAVRPAARNGPAKRGRERA